MNTKLHAIRKSKGSPLNLDVTAGHVSDYIVVQVLCDSLPDVDWLLGEKRRRRGLAPRSTGRQRDRRMHIGPEAAEDAGKE